MSNQLTVSKRNFLPGENPPVCNGRHNPQKSVQEHCTDLPSQMIVCGTIEKACCNNPECIAFVKRLVEQDAGNRSTHIQHQRTRVAEIAGYRKPSSSPKLSAWKQAAYPSEAEWRE